MVARIHINWPGNGRLKFRIISAANNFGTTRFHNTVCQQIQVVRKSKNATFAVHCIHEGTINKSESYWNFHVNMNQSNEVVALSYNICRKLNWLLSNDNICLISKIYWEYWGQPTFNPSNICRGVWSQISTAAGVQSILRNTKEILDLSRSVCRQTVSCTETPTCCPRRKWKSCKIQSC